MTSWMIPGTQVRLEAEIVRFNNHEPQPDGSTRARDVVLNVPGLAKWVEVPLAAVRPVADLQDGSVAFLESEVAFWRNRAETAEQRLKDAANFYPEAPPEPPIGTVFVRVGGDVAWARREDGWHCGRQGPCPSCPCEWVEACDFGIGDRRFERRLP